MKVKIVVNFNKEANAIKVSSKRRKTERNIEIKNNRDGVDFSLTDKSDTKIKHKKEDW